jgi:ribosomal protein S12 methylthiotransferase
MINQLIDWNPQVKHDTFYILNLGCSKNAVDAESMAQVLTAGGFSARIEPQDAEVLIVNTCGFIGSARDESIHHLQELAAIKAPHQYLVAAGCLSQRYGYDLAGQVDGLDGVIGTRRWMDILDLVTRLRARKHPEPLYHLPTDVLTVGTDEKNARRVSVEGSSAYLKIADGCRRPCAFCAIPAIKGTHVSRPIESIISEARYLRDNGVQEIILISQDSTDYGHDIGIKNGLAHLLRELVAAVPDVPWIRIMYAFPGYVTDELIETIATQPQIVNYLDMPLQHGHRETLKRMRRPANLDWVYATLDKMRAQITDLAIRTTFIVGYPGETDEEFDALMNFVRDMEFDRVGAFQYSYEEGTPSADVPGHVAEEVKQARWESLMELQQGISLKKNQAWVGRQLDVLIEKHAEAEDEDGNLLDETISIGRSFRDAPEIDGIVLIEGQAPIGEIVPMRVTGAMAYDLIGTVDIAAPNIIQPGTIINTDGIIQSPNS